MENLSLRVIIVAVSLFITMATFSVLVLYYDTAKQTADIVSRRSNIAEDYERITSDDIVENKTSLTGVEVRSLINKFASNTDVNININSISKKTVYGTNYTNINNTWLVTIKDNFDKTSKIISEEKLDLINPVWINKVTKTKSGNKTIYTLYLDE